MSAKGVDCAKLDLSPFPHTGLCRVLVRAAPSSELLQLVPVLELATKIAQAVLKGFDWVELGLSLPLCSGLLQIPGLPLGLLSSGSCLSVSPPSPLQCESLRCHKQRNYL